MPEFEKDFVLRQAKGMANALSKFMEKDSVDELLNLDEKQAENITHKEALDKKVREEIEKFSHEEQNKTEDENRME